MKVRVRGIYSTAISKILLDAGVQIVDPANVLVERLHLPKTEDTPDAEIRDLKNKTGVVISGANVNEIADIIIDKIKSAVVNRTFKGRIYTGIIKGVDNDNKYILVDTPDGEGLVDMRSFWGYVKPGNKILVQFKGTIKGKLSLSTQIRIFGPDCVLINNGFNRISPKIRSKEKRAMLQRITKELNIKDKGILWKASAAKKDENALKEEVSKLLEEHSKIEKEFEESTETKVLNFGAERVYILFTNTAFEELDKIREKVITTLPSHHILKSAQYSEVVDILENIEELQSLSKEKLAFSVQKTLRQYGPFEKRVYTLKLVRIDGKEKNIKGKIEKLEEKEGKITLIKIKTPRLSYTLDVEKGIITIEGESGSTTIITSDIFVFPYFARAIYLARVEQNNPLAILEDLKQKKLVTEKLFEELKQRA